MKLQRNKNFILKISQTNKIAPLRFTSAIVSLILGFHFCEAQAEEWEVTPSIEARVSYTDNVATRSTAAEESDVIGELLPGLVINGRGVNTRVFFDYQMQAIYYQNNSEQNEVFHQLDFEFSQNLLGDSLFLDAIGIYEQQVVDNRESAPPSNIFISANRTNTSSFQISPYFYRAFGGDIRLIIRPSYGEVHYEDLPQFDNTISQGVLIMERAPQQSSLGWHVSAQKREIEYDNHDKVELGRVDYGIDVPFSMRAVWFINGGQERNDYTLQQNNQSIDNTLWLTGLRWEPLKRTHLQFGVGERFFGNTYDFEFRHRSRYSQWLVEYHEDLETDALQIQPLLSAEQAKREYRQPIQTGLGGVSNEVYVVNRLVGSVTWSKAKSSVDFRIMDENRNYELSNREEKLNTEDVGYTWRTSTRTSINLNFRREDRDFVDQDREDITENYVLVINRNLTRGMSAQFQYQYSNINSNLDDFDHQYNLYTASIEAIF